MICASLFFVYRNQLPENVGFSLYSVTHLLFLTGIIIFIIAITLIYKRSDEKRQNFFRITIASTIVLMEVVKDLVAIIIKALSWEFLPLHLCGLSIFMIAIHAMKPNKFTAEFLYCLSIPGAVMALIFSDWVIYPVWNIFCLQSFLIHMLELTFPIMLLASGQIRPNPKKLWMPSLFLMIYTPIIFHLNHLLSTNFLFINEAAPDSPLSFLQNVLGNPGYVFGTIGILVIVWIIMYMPVVLWQRYGNKNFDSPNKKDNICNTNN